MGARLRISEKGATMVEYVLALSMLIFVFLVAGRLLERRGGERYDNSTKVVEEMAPCGGAGSSLSASECY